MKVFSLKTFPLQGTENVVRILESGELYAAWTGPQQVRVNYIYTGQSTLGDDYLAFSIVTPLLSLLLKLITWK